MNYLKTLKTKKMELFFKNDKGELKQLSLMQILEHSLGVNGFEMENGRFENEDHNWIGIVQETKKPSQVLVNICFKDDGFNITGVNVYETPIKTILDDDNSEKIV